MTEKLIARIFVFDNSEQYYLHPAWYNYIRSPQFSMADLKEKYNAYYRTKSYPSKLLIRNKDVVIIYFAKPDDKIQFILEWS